jgi:hypothetical protein
MKNPGCRVIGSQGFFVDPAIKYVMPECFSRASTPLDSRLRGNDDLDI